jgi:hypothetical protein
MDALTVFGMVVPAMVAFGILGWKRRRDRVAPAA